MTDNLLDYIERLVQYTRFEGRFMLGLSPRGALALVKASKSWAYLEGREFVVPEDVQAVFPSVAGHRLMGLQESNKTHDYSAAEFVLNHVDVLG